MRRLILALQLMTSLPLPTVQAEDTDFAAAIRWFPAAGIVVGGAAAAAMTLGLRVDPWAAALLALLAWVAVTGALHLDGLGDIADAAGAAHGDRARLSMVLADPHIGSFGVVALTLQLLTKLVLLQLWAEYLPAWGLIPLALIARIGPLAWTLWLPPLHQGLASGFRNGIKPAHLIAWSAIALAFCSILPLLACAALFIPLWAWWLRSRIGGISGDGHGAGIELVESALLAALVLAQ
jgi:adenosylcobinamide-GDP ribazoletransferase